MRVILHHAVRKDGNARVLFLFLNRDEIKVFHIRLSENVKPGKTVRENVKMFCAAENAAPFVSIGDCVRKGQTLCIIEAMKLMNEIPAEEEGVISEICVTNGQIVEYGTELFRIKR